MSSGPARIIMTSQAATRALQTSAQNIDSVLGAFGPARHGPAGHVSDGVQIIVIVPFVPRTAGTQYWNDESRGITLFQAGLTRLARECPPPARVSIAIRSEDRSALLRRSHDVAILPTRSTAFVTRCMEALTQLGHQKALFVGPDAVWVTAEDLQEAWGRVEAEAAALVSIDNLPGQSFCFAA